MTCPKVVVERQGRLKFLLGFFPFSLLLKRYSQVVVRIHVVRVRFQRQPELGDSTFEITLILSCPGQVVVGLGVVRIVLQRCLEFADGSIQLAPFCKAYTTVDAGSGRTGFFATLEGFKLDELRCRRRGFTLLRQRAAQVVVNLGEGGI